MNTGTPPLTQNEVEDLVAVLGTPSGRRVYLRIVCGISAINCSSFFPNIKDGACANNHMNFHEGVRMVGVVLTDQAKAHCPELANQMMQEALAKEMSDLVAKTTAKQSAGETNGRNND